ncbi:MAG: cell division protein ZapA [Candidatus Marinimicrobia bacterium]|nr:cell division protein ZapA [Candidatus Neomarinimicrobiota bacterium]
MTQIDEKQNEKNMTVEIYGQDYPIKGKVDPEFIKQVAEYVDDSMKEIGANMSSSLAIHKIAVIAAMNIAADYLKLSNETKNDTISIRDKSEQIIKLIDSKINK